MSDALNQDDVSALFAHMQEGATALAADAQALDQAAQTAADIAGEIHAPPTAPPAASTPVPAAAPLETAPGLPAHAFSPDVRRLLAIEVPVIVQLGIRRMNVGEVMRFSVGAIIEFSKAADEDLELLANNKSIGKGHAVKVGENFGIKLSATAPVKETIRKLGAA